MSEASEPRMPWGTDLSVTPGGDPAHGHHRDEIVIGGPSHTIMMPVVVDQAARGKRATFVAAGLAVLLVASAAVAAAWVWNGWGASLPENALPASSIAFARIDLAPGLGQQVTLKSLAERFPADEGGGAVEELTNKIVSGLGLEPLHYAADIKPWFGNRLGVAMWLRASSASSACLLTALASTDDAKATTALAQVREKRSEAAFGFAFHDGYAVTAACRDRTGSQAAAEAAVADSETQSLARSAAYASALDSLPNGQLVVAWADLNHVAKLITDEIASAGSGVNSGGQGAASVTDMIKGEMIVGLQPTDSGLDLRYRLRGGVAPGRATDALNKLGELPGSTILGVSADLRGSGGALQSSLITGFGATGVIADGTPTGEASALPNTFDAYKAFTRSAFTAAFTGFGDQPALRIAITAATEADSADINALLGREIDAAGFEFTRSAMTVTVTTKAFSAGGGLLSDSTRYRQVMQDAPANTVLAFYVDVERAAGSMELDAKQLARVKAVKAVGGSLGYAGTDAVGLIRLVIA